MDDDVELMCGHFCAHYKSVQKTASLDCHSPCFLRAEDGVKGLCPFTARVGDTIVVLYGGATSYMLRERWQSGSGEEEGTTWEYVVSVIWMGICKGVRLRARRRKDRR